LADAVETRRGRTFGAQPTSGLTPFSSPERPRTVRAALMGRLQH
jgi:hypothetical protein